MNILVLKDWNTSIVEFKEHWDGIMQAFCEISRKHRVLFMTKIDEFEGIQDINGLCVLSDRQPMLTKTIPLVEREDWDAIVAWGSLDRPWHQYLDEYSCPKVLCHAGGPTGHPNAKFFDAFCCESQVYIDAYKSQGKKAVRAFGTNTKIFRREARTPKLIDAIYPASFCYHKNQELFARAMGGKGLCVGNFNEQNIVGTVLSMGTPVLGRVSSEALCDLYNMSRVTIIPCGPQGGAQRVVLESMACGTPVIVASDNDKCVEFVEESGFGQVVEPIGAEIRRIAENTVANPPDPSLGTEYVKSKWTEHHYANSILEAISIAKS